MGWYLIKSGQGMSFYTSSIKHNHRLKFAWIIHANQQGDFLLSNYLWTPGDPYIHLQDTGDFSWYRKMETSPDSLLSHLPSLADFSPTCQNVLPFKLSVLLTLLIKAAYWIFSLCVSVWGQLIKAKEPLSLTESHLDGFLRRWNESETHPVCKCTAINLSAPKENKWKNNTSLLRCHPAASVLYCCAVNCRSIVFFIIHCLACKAYWDSHSPFRPGLLFHTEAIDIKGSSSRGLMRIIQACTQLFLYANHCRVCPISPSSQPCG